MKLDTLNRRKRNDSQSTGELVDLTPRDPQLCAALLSHGPLTAHLLQPQYNGNLGSLKRRLGQLFHEKEGGGPYLIRPDELNPRNGAKCEPAWYDLTPAGIALAKSDGFPRLSTSRKDPWHHRAATASTTVSFDTLAPLHGMRFISAEEIYRHEKCPNFSGNPLLLRLPNGKLEPDALFGFKYPEGYRFFALELDRATETIMTLQDKIEKYQRVFQSKLFQTHWGLLNLRVMIVTTAPGRVASLQKELHDQAFADRFLLKAIPTFGRGGWRAPREPVADLFTPWQRAGAPYDITKV